MIDSDTYKVEKTEGFNKTSGVMIYKKNNTESWCEFWEERIIDDSQVLYIFIWNKFTNENGESL